MLLNDDKSVRDRFDMYRKDAEHHSQMYMDAIKYFEDHPTDSAIDDQESTRRSDEFFVGLPFASDISENESSKNNVSKAPTTHQNLFQKFARILRKLDIFSSSYKNGRSSRCGC